MPASINRTNGKEPSLFVGELRGFKEGLRWEENKSGEQYKQETT
jgi:hypothetical protein